MVMHQNGTWKRKKPKPGVKSQNPDQFRNKAVRLDPHVCMYTYMLFNLTIWTQLDQIFNVCNLKLESPYVQGQTMRQFQFHTRITSLEGPLQTGPAYRDPTSICFFLGRDMVLPHFIIHYCLCLWTYQWTRLLRAAAFPMLRNCPPSNRVIKFQSRSANVIYSWTDIFTSFIFLCIIPLGSSLGPLHCIINSCCDFTVQHCYYIYGITSIMMPKMRHLLSFWIYI
jgi:hypothetical protein